MGDGTIFQGKFDSGGEEERGTAFGRLLRKKTIGEGRMNFKKGRHDVESPEAPRPKKDRLS